MSPMNRKIMILALSFLDLLTVALVIALAAMNKISDKTSWTVLIASVGVWLASHCAGLDGRSMAGFTILPTWLLIRAHTPRPSFLWGEMHNLKRRIIQVYAWKK